MWPVNGQYRCPECLRTYPVPWSNNAAESAANGAAVARQAAPINIMSARRAKHAA